MRKLCGIFLLSLAACAPINTEFSCKATAGDQCLSVEEAYAMSEHPSKKEGPCQACGRSSWKA